MNLSKQQLIAISLAICCAAVIPLQAEAKKKENKMSGTQAVVSSVPQPRSQKQVLVQNTPSDSRRMTTPNQARVQVRPVAATSQLTAKEAKKAAKQKEKEEKKKSSAKNKTKQQKNDAPVINKNNDKTGSLFTGQGALPKETNSVLPIGYKELGIFGEAVATKAQAVALLKQNNPDLRLTCSAEEIVDLYWQRLGAKVCGRIWRLLRPW